MKTIQLVILLGLALINSKVNAGICDVAECNFEPQAAKIEINYTEKDLDCLYKAVYNETRGNERHGTSMVVATILNRTQSPLFPSNVCGVVYQKAQFTNVHKVSSSNITDAIREAVNKSVALYEAGLLNLQVLFFHADYIKPKWSYQKKRVMKIGSHIFYK